MPTACMMSPSCSVKGDGTEQDAYLLFKEPVKLDGLKVTYTVDDDVFMGTGRDHWFAFSFIGRKIVFPYGMPGQNKMTDKTQGFAVRMVPDNDNINILVNWFDKALGFGAAEFLAMPEPGADSAIYGWGSQEDRRRGRTARPSVQGCGLGYNPRSLRLFIFCP